MGLPDPETPVGARGIGDPLAPAARPPVLNAIAAAVGDEVFVRSPVMLDHIVNALDTKKIGQFPLDGKRLGRRRYQGSEGKRAKSMRCPLLSALCTLLLLPSCSQPPPKPAQQTIIWERAGSWSGRGDMETNSFPGASGYLRFTWETSNETKPGERQVQAQPGKLDQRPRHPGGSGQQRRGSRRRVRQRGGAHVLPQGRVGKRRLEGHRGRRLFGHNRTQALSTRLARLQGKRRRRDLQAGQRVSTKSSSRFAI